jgi:signal transduction protein with GAF and PtsI domain
MNRRKSSFSLALIGLVVLGLNRPCVAQQARREQVPLKATAEQRRAAQSAVTQALATSATLDEATPRLLRGICTSLGWEAGGIWTVDAGKDVLVCHHFWHTPSLQIPEFKAITQKSTFRRGVGLPGRVWASGKPHWIVDVVHDTNFPRAPYAAKEGLHGAFAFPIREGKKVLGVLECFSQEIREPDSDLLRMFDTIDGQIARFIESKQRTSAGETAAGL